MRLTDQGKHEIRLGETKQPVPEEEFEIPAAIGRSKGFCQSINKELDRWIGFARRMLGGSVPERTSATDLHGHGVLLLYAHRRPPKRTVVRIGVTKSGSKSTTSSQVPTPGKYFSITTA